MKASLLGLSLGPNDLSPLHQVLIYGIHVLSQLRHFWDTFRTKLADKNPYTANIGGMRLRLAELQESDKEAQKVRAEGRDGYKEIDEVLHY